MNIEKFEKSEYYENLLIAISEESDNFSHIEKKFHCEISVDKEKHNPLQYTYYFEITSALMKGTMYVEIESGINNGTQINEVSFESSLTPKSRTIEVLKDVILDEKRVVDNGFSLVKAKAVFPSYKNEILELYRKSNYDNYVTGGGTTKTDSYYKKAFDKIRGIGLFWQCIYEDKEVDINFV